MEFLFLLLSHNVNGSNPRAWTPISWMSEYILDLLTIDFPSPPLPALSRRKQNSLLWCEAWLPSGLEEVRVLSYDFSSCLEGACCHHAGWGPGRPCHESTEAAGVGGAPPSLASFQSRETWGDSCLPLQQMFLILFYFFFSSMETLNHVSSFPVIYISHDSYQGSLTFPAQSHQLTKDAGHLFSTTPCPWEP